MGTTVHEDAARYLLDTMLDDPRWAAFLADTRRRMSLAASHPLGFPRGYADHIGDLGGPRSGFARWPLEQQAVFARFHFEICSGLISWTDIVIDESPSGDSLRKLNQEKLADLPHPFAAEVDQKQYGGDADGVLRWSQPILLQRMVGVPFLPPCRLNVQQGINLHHWVPPRSAPLEIGHSSPSRVLLHLREVGAVARWPYGSDRIRLFTSPIE